MESIANTFPDQHTPISEKLKPEWYRPTGDYLIAKGLYQKKLDTIKIWLDAANGIIDSNTIKYAISPLVSESGETFEYPGEIRETDLINVVREKNMGEYIELPYRFHVTVSNADAVEKRDMEVTQELLNLAQTTFITMMQEIQQKEQQAQIDAQQGKTNSQFQTPPIPDFQKFANDFANQWLDERAIQGQHILELINNVNNFEVKRLQAFYYWWATEEFYTYREIINNEVYTQIIHPLEGFPLRNSELFVEDYDGFVIKKRITWEECVSKYRNKIPKEQLPYFNDLISRSSNGGAIRTNPMLLSSQWMSSSDKAQYKNRVDSQVDVLLTDNSRTLNEYTYIWRTEHPIKYVTRDILMFGISQEIVADNYKLGDDPNDIEIKEEWIEEVWIGKRIGESSIGLYLEPEPCTVQRYDKHRNRPKLPVGGKQGILHGIAQNPVPARMIPYNIIDRLITLNIERSIAKYRDSITVIPQSMLNSDITGTYKEKMFYMKADGLLVYNDKSIDPQTVSNGFLIKSNTGLDNYFKNLIQIRDVYRRECLEIANMNPERMGDVDPSAGKSNTEQNIYRAKLGSLLSITMFNQALERDHNADLEFSKVAYAGGKVGTYFDRVSGQNIIVNIDPDKHLDSDYGVFVRNTKLDDDKIKAYKQYAFNASQNGEFELAGAAIEADTLPELRQALKQINEARRQLEQDMANQKNESIKYAADTQKEITTTKNQLDMQKAELNSDTLIRVAEINKMYDLEASDIDKNQISDASERLTKFAMEEAHHQDKLNLEQQNIDIAQQTLALKEKELKQRHTEKVKK